jgi:hypothetical protein
MKPGDGPHRRDTLRQPTPPGRNRPLFGAVSGVPNLGPNWNVAPAQAAMVARRHGPPHHGALPFGRSHLKALALYLWLCSPEVSRAGYGGGLPELAMIIDARKPGHLADIATEIFDCMAQAYLERDFEVADRLFRVWIKLPHPPGSSGQPRLTIV